MRGLDHPRSPCYSGANGASSHFYEACLHSLSTKTLNAIAISSITVYQRFISPYKGFCCAYHYHSGRLSCSEFARHIVKRRGVFALWAAMPRQFSRCKAAYAQILPTLNTDNQPSRRSQQRRNNRSSNDYSDCIPSPCDVVDASFDALPCDCSW
ncbi:MAG: membrane protein insertion efficiency factor YidD [Methylococcaceae bacterium]